MCSIIGVGERLHKVLGQTGSGTLDSGEPSLSFGYLFCDGLQHFCEVFLSSAPSDLLIKAFFFCCLQVLT